MTESFKAVSGGWTKPSEGTLKGTVDASLTARAVAGSETDENIEFSATVKITTGKGAVICNYTVDEDWNEHYVEMVLDPAGDTVKLEAVTRDGTGAETSRVTLASRNMSLAVATEYACRIVSKELSDGAYAVYGYIDDFLLVEAEDLDVDFQKGMHGLESLGADTNYSEYSYPAFGLTTWYCALADVKDDILKIEDHKSDSEIFGCIKSACSHIDNLLVQVDLTVPITVPQSIRDSTAHFAAWLFRRRLDPAGAEAFKKEAEQLLQSYIDGEREDSGFRVVQA